MLVFTFTAHTVVQALGLRVEHVLVLANAADVRPALVQNGIVVPFVQPVLARAARHRDPASLCIPDTQHALVSVSTYLAFEHYSIGSERERESKILKTVPLVFSSVFTSNTNKIRNKFTNEIRIFQIKADIVLWAGIGNTSGMFHAKVTVELFKLTA